MRDAIARDEAEACRRVDTRDLALTDDGFARRLLHLRRRARAAVAREERDPPRPLRRGRKHERDDLIARQGPESRRRDVATRGSDAHLDEVAGGGEGLVGRAKRGAEGLGRARDEVVGGVETMPAGE